MISRKSSNFVQIRPLTLGLYVLEHLKKYPHRLVMEKMVSPRFLDCFHSDPFKLT